MGDGCWVLGRRNLTPITHHLSPLRPLAPIRLDLTQKARGFELLSAVTAGSPGKVQALAGTGHRHVAQSALLLDALRRAQAALVRQRALLQPSHEYDRPLQPLGTVDSQQ